jgi:hypothetical protein
MSHNFVGRYKLVPSLKLRIVGISINSFTNAGFCFQVNGLHLIRETLRENFISSCSLSASSLLQHIDAMTRSRSLMSEAELDNKQLISHFDDDQDSSTTGQHGVYIPHLRWNPKISFQRSKVTSTAVAFSINDGMQCSDDNQSIRN